MQTFHISPMHKNAYEKINNRLLKLPILYLLDYGGTFQLISNTSKTVEVSALSQIQNGTPKSIG